MTITSVTYNKKALKDKLRAYELIRDCIDGEQTVKSRRTKYLPQPNASDTSVENSERYNSYLLRATFYGATKRTLDGLAGQIFAREPQYTIPPELEPLIKNVDGSGITLTQLAKKAVRDIISLGRGGLFTDYPAVTEPVTIAQALAGDIRPTIEFYRAEDIINWRTATRGATTVLALVVLREFYYTVDNEFEETQNVLYRVLRLNAEGNYTVQLYFNNANSFTAGEVITPKKADGNPLNTIPFTFIGAINNDTEVDQPPLYDIASLNIAHYRNSADYEDSCFFVGQPTPVFSGLTESWVKDVLKNKVLLGSRAAIPLPEGGNAFLLQANPNSMPKEAMDKKEKQMIALGAKLIEGKSVEVTATEAVIEKIANNSILADITDNTSNAFQTSLEYAAEYAGADKSKIKFGLNKDFIFASMTSEERRQLIAEWQAGAILKEEMREGLRRAGTAFVSLEDYDAKIKDELGEIPGLDINVDNNIKTGANDIKVKKQPKASV
jgi:hypothetical protein